MPKIQNKKYKQYLETKKIKTIDKEKIEQTINKIKAKNKKEIRALIIIMYYTGAKPTEILQLTAGDIKKQGQSYIEITITNNKKQKRIIPLRQKAKFIKEIITYTTARPENMYLFPTYRSKTTRKNKYITKQGIEKNKQYQHITNGLTHHFKKWFKNEITPHLLRHNRFIKISQEGGTMKDIMILKGSTNIESVKQYITEEQRNNKKIARIIK